MNVRNWLTLAVILIGSVAWSGAWAQSPMPMGSQAKDAKDAPSSSTESRSSSSPPLYASILRDAKPVTGMWNLYQKGNNLYWEVAPSDYSSEYIVLIAISRGNFGHPLMFGGLMVNGFGDDWVWQFRKVGESVHVVRRNVRFKANANSPEARAVAAAYTDSVLFSLPIMTKGPKGGDLVDLSQVFMSDLPQVGRQLPGAGFSFSSQKSSWAKVKGFDENMELEVAATYASSGQQDIVTVPDSRGVTINIHYSLSKITNTGYQPRLADDRIGYFLTAVKDFSKNSNRDRFVRYITRWDLQKADSTSDLSPPKKPIVFFIEKTVPFKYRKAVYDGIYEWNKALEKAGFVNAIEVHQQLDNDDKDPEDIRYNFFRWVTHGRAVAVGPTHVNPYTGQILNADITFDADFLTDWKEEYELYSPLAFGSGAAIFGRNTTDHENQLSPSQNSLEQCFLGYGMPLQLAFGSVSIEAYSADAKASAENLEKLIQQAIKETTMHEVGHTLGLMHNFKASTWRTLADLNDTEKSRGCLSASVMDYNPTNIVPKGFKQGDYYNTTLGPYDYWAIEYGYKPFSLSSEAAELKKIAARSGEPALQFATDDDTAANEPDPDSNLYDLGSDSFEFAKSRLQIVKDLMPGMVDRVTKEGDDYVQARRTFQILMGQYSTSMYYVSRNVGGLKTSRSHKGDKDAKAPITLVDAKLQREALGLLEENMFSDKNFQFPPELFNQLGWSNWNHWGTRRTDRKDFGVHDFVLQWQDVVLQQLLANSTLHRMHDAELKAAPETDVLTTAELIQRLTKAIFAEVEATKESEYSNRKPAISSLRRNLQRTYLKELSELALGASAAPQDCQTIAYAELTNLQQRIKSLLDNQPVASKLDVYSRAHLQESAARIGKVLDARMQMPGPGGLFQIRGLRS